MIFIAAALIVGLSLVYLLAPLMQAGQVRSGYALLLLIGGGALGLYLWQGNPDMPDQPIAPRLAEQQIALKEVANGIDKLKANLEANPDDISGWLLLADSCKALGQKAEQKLALARAIALLPDAAPIKARLRARLDDLKQDK